MVPSPLAHLEELSVSAKPESATVGVLAATCGATLRRFRADPSTWLAAEAWTRFCTQCPRLEELPCPLECLDFDQLSTVLRRCNGVRRLAGKWPDAGWAHHDALLALVPNLVDLELGFSEDLAVRGALWRSVARCRMLRRLVCPWATDEGLQCLVDASIALRDLKCHYLRCVVALLIASPVLCSAELPRPSAYGGTPTDRAKTARHDHWATQASMGLLYHVVVE